MNVEYKNITPEDAYPDLLRLFTLRPITLRPITFPELSRILHCDAEKVKQLTFAGF